MIVASTSSDGLRLVRLLTKALCLSHVRCREAEVVESRQSMTEGPCSLSSPAGEYGQHSQGGSRAHPAHQLPADVMSTEVGQMFDEFFNFAWEVQRNMQQQSDAQSAAMARAHEGVVAGEELRHRGGFWRRLFGRGAASQQQQPKANPLAEELLRDFGGAVQQI